MSLANLITLARLLLTPFVVYCLLTHHYALAFWAFMIAGLTDAVDGYIAKRWEQKTELGAYLDPIADKALLVSIYVVLGYLGPIPVWLVVAAVSRDLLIVGAFLLAWMLERRMRVAPPLVSKANTASQIALAVVALAELGLGFDAGLLRASLIGITAVLIFASAAMYLVLWIRHMQRSGISGTPGGVEQGGRKSERVG